MSSIQTNIRKVIAFIGWSFKLMINMPLSTIVSKFLIISKNRLDTQAFRKRLFYQVYGMPINKKEVVTLSKKVSVLVYTH